MPELFAAAVARHPERVALVTGDRSFTFAELGERVRQITGLIVGQGVGAGDVVALAMPRHDMVPAILGVLAAGAAYLPLDTRHPAERTAFMLDDAAPALVLTGTEAPAEPADAVAVDPAQAAYVIYTSGSTGVPKGVIGTHAGLANLFGSHHEDLIAPAGPGPLRVVHLASFSFDGSWEPLLWLLAGHALHVVDEAVAIDPPALLAHLDEHACLLYTSPSPRDRS